VAAKLLRRVPASATVATVVAPEQRASELLATIPDYVWDGSSLPVPVEVIADTHFGLLVRDLDDLALAPGAPALRGGEQLSGLLLVEQREIWVNAGEAQEWPGRRRFTIGHELGHWVLHRPRHSVFCRSGTLTGDEQADGRDIEEEASLFAAALMFPPGLVRDQHAAVGGDLEALRERFGASRMAMERAVCAAVRRPQLESLPDVAFFYWDDPGYEAWRYTNLDEGFVLNDDLSDGGRSRLHRARCSYLDRVVDDRNPRTRYPKWCSTDVEALRAALPAALGCGRCRP
jgi:hypothetical protein